MWKMLCGRERVKLSHEMKEIKILSNTKNLAKVRRLLSQFLLKRGVCLRQIDEIKLAVDEAITNIIEHAYQFHKGKEIYIQLKLDENRFYATLHDRGRSFALEKVPEPHLEKYILEERDGGLGVFLIRNLMDKVTYCHREGGYNEMVMVKQLKGGEWR